MIAEAERPGHVQPVHHIHPDPVDRLLGIVVHEVAGVHDEIGLLLGDDGAEELFGGPVGLVTGVEVGVGKVQQP